MPDLILKAKTRAEKKKQVDKLRKQGEIPAVLYGHKIKPLNLTVSYSIFEKIYRQAGESTLVDLLIDDQKPIKVLIQDRQLDPKTNQFIHIDFHQVRMDEKLHTEIELNFSGEAPAVKELSGILVTNLHSLEVECLPNDLVHQIDVDLSPLKTFDDAIHVSDIKVPQGIAVLNISNDVVALVQPPRSEKELEELEAKPEEKLAEGVAEEKEKPEEGVAEEKEKPEEQKEPAKK